jgi:hypothetical protein
MTLEQEHVGVWVQRSKSDLAKSKFSTFRDNRKFVQLSTIGKEISYPLESAQVPTL